MTEKFIDGTPVPPDYQARVAKVIGITADAIERFNEDELERYAVEQRRLAAERKRADDTEGGTCD